MGKILIVIGILLIIAGMFIHFNIKIPLLGKLPGDFAIKKEGFSFYFPLTSSILISLIITLIMLIIRYLKS